MNPEKGVKRAGAAMRTIRAIRGYSQQQVADWMGVSRSAVGHWETGFASPNTRQIYNLAVIYRVPATRLLPDDEPIPEAEEELRCMVAELQGRVNRLAAWLGPPRGRQAQAQ